MREEIRVFFTALMFYTRIPCPSWVDHSAEYLNKATRYFPLIGWIVGGISAGVFALCHLVLPVVPSIILAISAGVMATGAFHEDGFADVCDGIGGGWTPERILDIMKDSRVGAYGAIGFMLLLAAKISALAVLPPAVLIHALLAGHPLSRLFAALFIRFLPYVRADEQSKAKPVAKAFPTGALVVAVVLGLIPLLGWAVLTPQVLIAVAPALVAWVYLRRLFVRNLGGYTGDCLGATQQLTETAFYLGIAAVWTSI
ncbi:MAG: adenosylcobinamide-GDP ribazoletransferase [Bacteroidota bacterium]